jgi:hypothetical protein
MFLEIRARPVGEACSLTGICVPIAETMLDPIHLTTLQACTVCYGDSLIIIIIIIKIIIKIIIDYNIKKQRISEVLYLYVDSLESKSRKLN